MILAAVSATFAACSSNEPDIPEDTDQIPGNVEASSTMNVYVYPGIQESDGITPRMTIMEGDLICTELYDPQNPSNYVFHYMDTKQHISSFMTASDKGVVILEDDPFSPQEVISATLLSVDATDVIVSTGTFSKRDNSYSITKTGRIKKGTESSQSKAPSRTDDMDFARSLIMKDIIKPLGDAISKADKLLDHIPFTQSAKDVLSIWSDWGLVVAEAHLYSNNEEEYKKILAEKMFIIGVKKIKCVNKVLDTIDKSERIYRAGMAAYNEARNYDYDNYESVSSDFMLAASQSSYRTCLQAQESSWEIFDESSRYNPQIRLVSVDGQTATVCGSFSNDDGRFTVTGYYLYCDNREIGKAQAALDGTATYSFTNLEKGKEYAVTSYATVMGVTYESNPVRFRIDGDLELSEYSLTFSENGGKAEVEVTLPSENWTLQCSGAAQWCRATASKKNSISIEVSPSNESRQTSVTVTATSPKGEKQSKSITVEQKSIGTFAAFKGTCKMVHKCEYPSAPSYNFTQEYNVELVLMLMRMGNSTSLTITLPESGLTLMNWTVSNSRPAGNMIQDGYTLTSFNCASTSTLISIDGSTKGPDNSTNQFSIKVDLASLKVKILETGKSHGTGYPGMSKPEPYNSQYTLSGTLHYYE